MTSVFFYFTAPSSMSMSRPTFVYDAGFFRIGAWLWDSILISLPLALVAAIAPINAATDILFSHVVQMLYYTYFVAAWQTTPCGRVVGLRVIDAKTLGRPTLWQCYVRTASQVLLIYAIYKIGVPTDMLAMEDIESLSPEERRALTIGGVMVLAWYGPVPFTKSHTALHDIISGTRVVRLKKK